MGIKGLWAQIILFSILPVIIMDEEEEESLQKQMDSPSAQLAAPLVLATGFWHLKLCDPI